MKPEPRRIALVTLLMVLAGGQRLPAQPNAVRLARDEPEVAAQLGGRAGACDALAFSPDGATLFAAGDDKVVHRWAAGPAGLRYDTPIRWNTFREQRGAVYALALSPAHGGRRVAFAGYGKLTADVVVAEATARGFEVTRALSAKSPKPTPYAAAGHAVWSLAFDPTGERLLAGHDDGSVWEWDLAGSSPDQLAVRAVAAATAPTPTPDSRVVWVGYAAGGGATFLRGDGAGHAVAKGQAADPAAAPSFRVPGGRVKRAASSADGRTLVALPAAETAAGSSLTVLTLPGGRVACVVPYGRGRLPDGAALDAAGRRLAVVTRDYAAGAKPPFAHDPPGTVEVYDLAAGGATLAARAVVPFALDEVAFDPADARRLATAGGPGHETALWRLDGAALTPTLNDSATSVGRAAWGVGVTADGRHLCVRDGRDPTPTGPNARGAGPWRAFDLERRTWVGEQTPVPPLETHGGWRVEFDPVNEFTWYAAGPGGERHALPLSAARDDRPWCYTFVPGPGPVRLAVGHYWGASLFELAAGKVPRRVRRFTGHAGPVVAIAPAFGGRGLVTAGRDLSVCLWGLADWPDTQPVLGATFEARGPDFAVAAVAPGSPAWEAGLTAGDAVAQLYAGGRRAPLPRADWAAAVADPTPHSELAFALAPLAPGGGVRVAKTQVLHRPVVRFLPLRNNEWLMSRYREGYYDRSANGDRFAGWLLSKDAAHLPPEFFPLSRFEAHLRKPEKLAEALTRLTYEPDKVLLAELVPPGVAVAAAAPDAAGVRAVTVTVTPHARPDGQANAVQRVELWVDDHYRVGAQVPAGPFTPGVPIALMFAVPADAFKAGPNALRAVALGSDMAHGTGEAGVVAAARPGEEPRGRLFGLAVGINEYAGIGQSDLKCAVNDAGLVVRVFAAQKGVRFAGGGLEALEDEQVTKGAILAAIRAAAKDSRREDLFILYLSGHGTQVTAPKPGGPGRGWHLVIPRERAGAELARQAPADQARAWLSADEFFQELARVKAQPVVIMDSCHSGAATKQAQDKNAVRDLRPYGVGPVVMAACGEGELAWERPGGDHGFFTATLRDCLTTDFAAADTSKDGQLSLDEVFAYVQRRVPLDAREAGKREQLDVTQRPVLTPGVGGGGELILAGRAKK